MASDIKNTGEDVEMADCDGEKVVTMMDVLQEQEDFEEDANAVLGASDEKECTYFKGYIKRQAIYACLTCCSEAKSDPTKRAGVCLACSLMCHENHELIELYTKRNFRCDCGNPKFNSHPCTFVPNKNDINEDNSYNQNFSGLYCTCHRPYPDPESTVEDEMIQCIICEDWLHASHLEASVPTNNQYSEMICKTCMEKNEFLHDYTTLAVNTENADVDVVNVNGVKENISILCNSEAKTEEINLTTSITNETETSVEMANNKLETSITTDNTTDSKISEVQPSNSTDRNDENNVESVIENEKDETENINKKEEVLPLANEIDTKESEASADSAESVSEQVLSTNKCEKENTVDGQENAKDTLKQDAVTSNTEESSNPHESFNSEESSDVSKKQLDEQINENMEQSEKEENNENTNSDSKDIPEEDKLKNAEKIEEDRLLADPEDNLPKDTLTTDKTNLETESTDTKTVDKVSEGEPKDKTNESTIETPNAENESSLDIKSTNTVDVTINSDVSAENTEIPLKKDFDNCSTETSTNIVDKKEQSSPERISEKRKLEEANTLEAKKPKIDACIRPKGVKKIYTGATFWPSNFRQKLCTCQECISMYKDLSILFLTDLDDTVCAYESLGKEKFNGKPATQYEKGMQALSSLDRIQQINALTEYNRMRDKLLDFLKSFKDRKEIVKEEDIKAFFAEMKPKREPDGVYFCR